MAALSVPDDAKEAIYAIRLGWTMPELRARSQGDVGEPALTAPAQARAFTFHPLTEEAEQATPVPAKLRARHVRSAPSTTATAPPRPVPVAQEGGEGDHADLESPTTIREQREEVTAGQPRH